LIPWYSKCTAVPPLSLHFGLFLLPYPIFVRSAPIRKLTNAAHPRSALPERVFHLNPPFFSITHFPISCICTTHHMVCANCGFFFPCTLFARAPCITFFARFIARVPNSSPGPLPPLDLLSSLDPRFPYRPHPPPPCIPVTISTIPPRSLGGPGSTKSLAPQELPGAALPFFCKAPAGLNKQL